MIPAVLWWGRADPGYSRNRIVYKAFSDLGWTVRFFHPLSSPLGFLEAYLRRPERPQLIWVPCFRHRDIASARFWASKWKVPLVIDPLISAFQKTVSERNKFPEHSLRGRSHMKKEARLFSTADIVVADTPAHAAFFRSRLAVSAEKLRLLYVSAETSVFRPLPEPSPEPFEILFYGSFLRLQGVEVIIEAARKSRDMNILWTLLGDGDLRRHCQQQARGLVNVRFEPWIVYDQLPTRIAKAHVVLGIFGASEKADLVIPNKVFQAMAVARPVITRHAAAYAGTLHSSPVIGWVPPDDPEALAFLVKKWFRDPSGLVERGRATRALFDLYFGREKINQMLQDILNGALNRSKTG